LKSFQFIFRLGLQGNLSLAAELPSFEDRGR
jgi:hypothetical protein